MSLRRSTSTVSIRLKCVRQGGGAIAIRNDAPTIDTDIDTERDTRIRIDRRQRTPTLDIGQIEIAPVRTRLVIIETKTMDMRRLIVGIELKNKGSDEEIRQRNMARVCACACCVSVCVFVLVSY